MARDGDDSWVEGVASGVLVSTPSFKFHFPLEKPVSPTRQGNTGIPLLSDRRTRPRSAEILFF